MKDDLLVWDGVFSTSQMFDITSSGWKLNYLKISVTAIEKRTAFPNMCLLSL